MMHPLPILRDPLLHFVAFGFVLFVISLAFGRGIDNAHRIEVTAAKQVQMARLFRATWGRPPSGEELTALIEEQVRNEVYYREALAFGLDKDDIVVRQRMRQKLEFLQADADLAHPPSEADLTRFYHAHRAKYGEDVRYSFHQVTAPVAERSGAFLAKVRLSQDPSGLSDVKLLPYAMTDAPFADVERTFGEEFANALGVVPIGAWTGPVPSTFGTHFVELQSRKPVRIRPFEEVKARVLSDYLEARDAERTEAAYRAWKARYRIVVAPRPSGVGAR